MSREQVQATYNNSFAQNSSSDSESSQDSGSDRDSGSGSDRDSATESTAFLDNPIQRLFASFIGPGSPLQALPFNPSLIYEVANGNDSGSGSDNDNKPEQNNSSDNESVQNNDNENTSFLGGPTQPSLYKDLFTYKVVVAGGHSQKKDFQKHVFSNEGVGKTHLVKRFTDDQYKFGALCENEWLDFTMKIIPVRSSIEVKLQIWDTPATSTFRRSLRATKVRFTGMKACILVFDLANEDSFKYAKELYESLQDIETSSVLFVLVGTKSDLLPCVDAVDKEEIALFVKEKNIPYFACSAKNNKNVKEIFHYIAEQNFRLDEQLLVTECLVKNQLDGLLTLLKERINILPKSPFKDSLNALSTYYKKHPPSAKEKPIACEQIADTIALMNKLDSNLPEAQKLEEVNNYHTASYVRLSSQHNSVTVGKIVGVVCLAAVGAIVGAAIGLLVGTLIGGPAGSATGLIAGALVGWKLGMMLEYGALTGLTVGGIASTQLFFQPPPAQKIVKDICINAQNSVRLA